MVFRKANIEMEDAQAEFARRVEDYVTGRFRDTFTGIGELLPKIAAVLCELDQEGEPRAPGETGLHVAVSGVVHAQVEVGVWADHPVSDEIGLVHGGGGGI
ncbi:MAG: hypothetical protein ACRD0V_18430 [Acidimicrobiales bacterium]